MRDSALLMTGELLSPAPWSPDSMYYNLMDACIGHPYNQSVTVNVPAMFQGFAIQDVSIATTGAISNLPVGITYNCDPPNCVFQKNTLGCIRLYGIPTTANIAPDTFDLGITAMVNVGFATIPVQFPGQLAPGSHYYLALKDSFCLVGTSDQNTSLGYLSSAPNPFSEIATITVESIVPGDYQFEVFNLLGKRVHARTIRLDAGVNQFNFDGSTLPNGSYIYSIGNIKGKATRRMMIVR